MIHPKHNYLNTSGPRLLLFLSTLKNINSRPMCNVKVLFYFQQENNINISRLNIIIYEY